MHVESPSLRIAIVTMDRHVAGPAARARARLSRAAPGLRLTVHAAAEWAEHPAALEEARAAIAEADIIIANMLFLDEHVQAIRPALEARREGCDAMVCLLSAGEIVRLTKLGRLDMSQPSGKLTGLLKRLRGSSGGRPQSGARQMDMLRRLPRLLRWIPGKAQDLRSYFLCMQYWLAASDDNVAAMVGFLASRYAQGPRADLAARLPAPEPEIYPEVGLYHPRLKGRVTETFATLPRGGDKGTVGLLLMRAYVLAGDTDHYDAVIVALEARGLTVIPAFASGLDARPAMEAYFHGSRGPRIDALLSLTGFSLVGGPAYNDGPAAEEALAALDVPYVAAHAVEFQTLEAWAEGPGLGPVEATMLVALPEIDGATGPMVFGGRGAGLETPTGGDATGEKAMRPAPERVARLADRVARLVALRRSAVAKRKAAIVLFGFPPNAGAVGTAAHLSVFESLHNVLHAMKAEGWTVEPPATVDDLRRAVLSGGETYGQPAAILARIPADDLVKREPHLREIEAQWGPAPGRHQTDGSGVFVLGARFGNIAVCIQPAFGHEGDPMRLLFEKGFAPTHAFCAFYRWIREDFGADAALHFGMHGALEFMPGKQCGLGPECWPDRLIGDLPNICLYAANNPSEGTLAKRRAAATLVSHLTPPLARAGLYKGLADLRATLERWRESHPGDPARPELARLLQAQAAALDFCPAEPEWPQPEAAASRLWLDLMEHERSLIPHGLHIVGAPSDPAQRAELLAAMAEMDGADPEALAEADRLMAEDHETPALLRALGGRFIRPVPGGDLLRNPSILPTGRNIHAFDPYRMPTAFAVAEGARQADRLIARHVADHGAAPRSVALVLWGSDNIKSDGGPIAQALALMGAKPRTDSYGRLCGALLVPLEELGRPRIDVLMTLSGRVPGPAADPDPDAGGSRLARRLRRRAGGRERRPRPRPRLRRQGRLRSGNRRPARLLQRRGRLRLQRQSPDRLRRLGRRGRTRRRLRGPQVLRLWPRRPRRRAARPPAGLPRRGGSRLPEPRERRARRHHGGPLLRHARRRRPRREARPGRGPARLYRRLHHRDRQGPLPVRAGGAGDPHPRPQPQVARGAAQARP